MNKNTKEMTYREIFAEIYSENKREILAYITFALVVSIFMFGGSSRTMASSEASFMSLGGGFTGSLNLLLCYMFPTIEPCIGMGISAILAILADYSFLPDFMNNIDLGLLSISWPFRIAIFVWVVVSVLPRYFGVSRIFGICLESINDKYVGFLVLFMNLLPGLFQIDGTVVTEAADMTISANQVASGGGFLHSVIAFLMMLVTFVCYYFIRYFLMFIDVTLIPASAIPGVSIAIEILKLLSCVSLMVLSYVNVVAFIILYILLLVVSILLFRKAYIAVRYFKNIYYYPLIHKLFKSQKVMPMVPDKIPARLQKKLAGREIQMLIPAYPIKKIASYKYFEKYDQWWLLIDSANRVSICKAAVGKDQLYELGITSTMQNKIFINKAIRFVEIFSVPGEKNIGKKFSLIKKDLHFVVSKDYVQYYDEIKNRSGFVDYAEYSKSMKERQENQGNINPMAQKV